MRKIKQLDDLGNVIATYDSIANAASFHECDESSIRKVINKDGRKSCGWIWVSEDIPDVPNESISIESPVNGPKILLLDIETAPLLAFVFQKQVWKAHIGSDKVVSDWFMLTYSCKWLNYDTIYSDRLTGNEALLEDDSRLIKKLWCFLEAADIVIAHNGDHFDIPNINTRFILNGLPPTSPYKQIDTLKVAQRQFGFTHNNLDGLAAAFGIGAKIETTFELWKRCLHGSDEALAEMETYNQHDVELLEQIYLYLRPWIRSHATSALYKTGTETSCPYCGSHELTGAGYHYTLTGKYAAYRCNECGGISRSRISVAPKNKELLISIPGR